MLCPRCALERLCVSHRFTIPIFLKCHKAWGTSNKCLFNKIQNSSVEGTSRWIKITYWWTFSINYICIYWVCSKVRAHWFINTYWPHIYIPFLKNNWMCEILPDITGQPLHFVNSTYRVITCQVFSTTIKSSPSSHPYYYLIYLPIPGRHGVRYYLHWQRGNSERSVKYKVMVSKWAPGKTQWAPISRAQQCLLGCLISEAQGKWRSPI